MFLCGNVFAVLSEIAESCEELFKVDVPFCSPLAVCECFIFSTSLSLLVIIFFYFSHPAKYKVVSYCGFDLHFFNK